MADGMQCVLSSGEPCLLISLQRASDLRRLRQKSSLSSSLNFSCQVGQLVHTSSEMSCFFFFREGGVLSSALVSGIDALKTHKKILCKAHLSMFNAPHLPTTPREKLRVSTITVHLHGPQPLLPSSCLE